MDGPTPAPTPDSCLTGAACDGCSLTVEVNGLTYCCNNYCDIGWINVDPATDPLCQCGHDWNRNKFTFKVLSNLEH